LKGGRGIGTLRVFGGPRTKRRVEPPKPQKKGGGQFQKKNKKPKTKKKKNKKKKKEKTQKINKQATKQNNRENIQVTFQFGDRFHNLKTTTSH